MNQKLEANIFHNFINFKGGSTLKKAVLNLMVRQSLLDCQNDDSET